MKTKIAVFTLSVLLLAGCTPAPGPAPDRSDDTSGGEAAPPCLVGQWDLDIVNYSGQAADYLASLNIPFVDFSMTGSQVLTFSADGGLELGTDVTAGGTITVPGFTGPVSTSTQSLSAGNWSEAGDGSLTIENWAPIGDVVVTGTAPEGVDLGGFDLDSAVGMTVLCDDTSLFLQGPDAQLGSYWTRR